MIWKLMTIGFVAVMAIITLPVQAAGYIKVGDIKGESRDELHKGWIDVDSFAFATIEAGEAGGKSREPEAMFGDIVIVVEADKSSPKLLESVSKGTVYPSTIIEITDEFGTLRQLYELSGVKITSYSVNGSGLDDGFVLTQELSLNFEEMRLVAFPLDPDEPLVESYHSRSENL